MTNNNIYFVANWKMFGSIKSVNLLNKVISYSKTKKHKAKIIYCPPYTLIKSFVDKTKNSNIEIVALFRKKYDRFKFNRTNVGRSKARTEYIIRKII